MQIEFKGSRRIDLHTVHAMYEAQYTHNNKTKISGFITHWSCLNHTGEIEGCFFTGIIESKDEILLKHLDSIIAHGPTINYDTNELGVSTHYEILADALNESIVKRVAIKMEHMTLTAVSFYEAHTDSCESHLTLEYTINDVFVVRYTESQGFTIPTASDVTCDDSYAQDTAHRIHDANLIAQRLCLPTTFENAIKVIFGSE